MQSTRGINCYVTGPKVFWAIEVKNTTAISSEDTKALNIFLEDYPEAQLILLYRGNDCFRKGKAVCLPCELFLQKLIPDQPLLEKTLNQ